MIQDCMFKCTLVYGELHMCPKVTFSNALLRGSPQERKTKAKMKTNPKQPDVVFFFFIKTFSCWQKESFSHQGKKSFLPVVLNTCTHESSNSCLGGRGHCPICLGLGS